MLITTTKPTEQEIREHQKKYGINDCAELYEQTREAEEAYRRYYKQLLGIENWAVEELKRPDYPEGYPLNGDSIHWPDGWKLKDGWGVYPQRTSPRFAEAVEYFLNRK